MATLTGTFLDAADVPVAGSVSVTPDIAAVTTALPAYVTQSPVGAELDADGKFTVTVKDSNSADWGTTGPVPYIIEVNVTGLRFSFMAYLDGEQDLTELLPLAESPELSQYLTVAEGDARYWLRTETPGGGGGSGALPRYEYQSVADINSIGQLWTRLITLPIPADMPEGIYEIGVAVEWYATNADEMGYFRISDDNGAFWHSFAEKNADPMQADTFFFQRPIEHLGGAITLLVEAKCETGTIDIAQAHNWMRQVRSA